MTNNKKHDNHKRGKEAPRPKYIPLKGWKQIAKRIKNSLGKNHVRVISAGVAFFFFMSLFPIMAALVSIYGLVTDMTQIQEQISMLTNILPADAQKILSDFLTNLVGKSQEALSFSLIFSSIITLFLANRGTVALFEGINIVYNEPNKRNIFQKFGVTLLFTIGGIIAIIIGLVLVAGIPAVVDWLPLSETLHDIVVWLRWPLIAVGIMLFLGFTYKIAPQRKSPRIPWVSWGAVISTLLWLGGSILFSIYINNFTNFDNTYGSFAAIIILMLWFFLTSFVIMLGAVINTELEHQTRRDTTVGDEKPMGKRGAFFADHVAGEYSEKQAKEYTKKKAEKRDKDQKKNKED